MGRIIGKYKNQNITMRAMHLSETYAGLLIGRRDDKWRNIERVNVTIDGQCRGLFGSHAPYVIADYNEIDYSRPLPPETVYAHLDCVAATKEECNLHLVLVWFQQVGQDPFAMAVEKLKTIDWEKQAKDFEY